MFQRFVSGKLMDVLSNSPVVLLHGPPECGKSMVVKALSEAAPHKNESSHEPYKYFSFRDSHTEELASRDPIRFFEQLPDYVILDHVTYSEEMFVALHNRIKADRKPGAFIFARRTGEFMREFEKKFGKELACVPMYPLAQSEVNAQTTELSFKWGTNSLLSCLLEGRVPLAVQDVKLYGEDLAKIVVDGGYPEPLQLPRDQRRDWYLAYINSIWRLQFFVMLHGIDAIPIFMSRIVEQTTTFYGVSRLSKETKMPRHMLQSLLSQLHESFITELLPVWPTNTVSRMKSKKLYMSDTGLASLMLNLDSDQLWQNRPLFEKLVENLIYLELRRQLSWMKNSNELYHCQDKGQAKVDFVIEQPDQTITGINVAAGGSVSDADFDGLRHVAARVPSFNLGVVLYDGESVMRFDEQMLAVPIRMLFENGLVE